MLEMRRATIPSIGAALLVLFWTLPVHTATLPARVLRVPDSDTVTVLAPGNAQYQVRLAGIDAPALTQRYGQAAREHLLRHIAGRFVLVNWQRRDEYGRIVGKVLLSGRDVGLRQIQAGLAWHDKRHQNEQSPEERAAYARAEQEARDAKRGLWADSEPTPPWEWTRR